MKLRTKLIIFVIVLAIVGTTVGILIWYFGGSGIPPSPPAPPAPPAPPSPPSPSQQTGLWIRNPGSAYSIGLGYSDSQDYCQNNNAQMATKLQLLDAYSKGFEYCSAGWLENGDAGYVMQSVKPNCGQVGFNQADTSNQATPYGTYCYGPIPTTNDVGASVAI